MIADKKDFSIRTAYIVYAQPEKVFEALTDPGIIAAWGGGFSIVEHEEGGRFELFDGWAFGEVITFSPGKELSFTWKVKEWDRKTPASRVRYLFKAHPAGTEVVLSHTELPTQEEADKHAMGWVDYVFDPLNEYFTQ